MSAVVITGMGASTSLGDGLDALWSHLSQPLRLSDVPATTGYRRALSMAESAAEEALTTAGLWYEGALVGMKADRLGSTVSASKPLWREGRWAAPDALGDAVAARFQLEGERRNVIAACATGAYSISLAASWIEQGLCDAVLAGSAEPSPHPLYASGFRQMGVLSPEGVTRPFDRRRSGFVFGEGAGMLVLESDASAHRRGQRPLARLSGWALGADSHSPVAFNSNGAKIASVVQRALRKAGLPAKQVRHVNAHGTGTRLNDWIETQALLQVYGPDRDRLMISATKAATGHLLGASGSVECIITILSLLNRWIPPTATLEEPDPECPLDYTPRQGHAADVSHALSLSFGFGGPIGALLVSA